MTLCIICFAAKKKLKYELPKLKGCELIGYPNATINECGYCVGSGTGLDTDYGKDCEGTCFGDAVNDCEGVCGGNAYIDECTGVCMTEDEPLNKEVINGTGNRDCRGLCIPPELSPPQQAYDRDECGVCRLQNTEKSAFVDCNGNCQLMGREKVSLVCGQCVDKNAHIMDDCGNCRNEKHICSCDRDASICGCNDPNNCYVVKAVNPRAVPNNIDAKLLLLGYFHPVVRDLNCFLENEVTGDILSFPVSFIHKNKTALECNVNIKKEGSYVISLGIIKNSINSFRKDFIRLIVYDPNEVEKLFELSEMTPKNTSTSDSNETITLQFSDPSNSLFGIPFRCKLFYSIGNREQLTDETNQLNSCSIKPTKLRSHSQTVEIHPTFDGINLLSKPFQFNITAQSPQISYQNCYVSEDGLVVIIQFETPVHITQHFSDNNLLEVCEQLLTNETIDYLSFYGLKSCLWASKKQLIITTDKSIAENLVHIKFKKYAIRESDQMLAISNQNQLDAIAGKLSAEPSWWSYEPNIAITGPSEIPECGIFALIGHYSSPRGTTNVKFQWDVLGEVSNELKEHIENNGKSTNLILDADFFDYHTPYKFVFKAFIPVREQTLEVGHTLVKLEYDSPIVSIYHTRLLQSTPLYSDQDILLLADISVPECVFPVQRIVLFWKVIEPKILFPLNDSTKLHSITYEIKPNSVPIDKPVDIYLNAFLGHRHNETIGARFTFVSSKAPLKSSIANGSTKIAIGSKSGIFKLSSTTSKSNRSLVYQWSCHESLTAQPCYHNFGASNHISKTSPLLIDRTLQRLPDLMLNSSFFKPNKQYWFGLQVFDKNDRKVFSETEYTLVKVVDGFAPQVYMGPVFIKGHRVPYNARLATHLVPAHTQITVRAIVKPSKFVKSIKWEAPNGLFDLNWSNEYIGNEIQSELHLHESSIVAFGSYNVKLIACNENNECSDADTSLLGVQSVTMCELSVEHFSEYQLSLANVEKCNTPPNSAPLTYQLFLADENLPHLQPLSVPQFSGVIKFMGTPILYSTPITRFAAQVCDRYGNCQLYYSQSVTIEPTDNETSAISDIIKIAKRYQTAGDSIGALSSLGTVLIKQDSNPLPIIEKVVNDSIDFSRHALELTDQMLTEGHLSVIYNTLSNGLLRTQNVTSKQKLLNLIQKYTLKAIALKVYPKVDTIKNLYSKLMKSFVKSESHLSSDTNFMHELQLLEDIRKTFKLLRTVAATQTPLGQKLRLISSVERDGLQRDIAITDFIHSYKIYDVNIRAQFNPNTTIETRINFGEEVKQNYSSFWNCGQHMLCQSVIFSVTIYPNESPYPYKSYSHKLSPIIDLSIHAPNTGAEQTVRGLFKAAAFQTSLTGNASIGGSDYITKCHFYDERSHDWLTDDMNPLGIAYKKASCLSGHLSTFVVLRIVAGITVDYVIGVAVACLMGVLVFGIMLVFFVQKKREDNNRISPDNKPVTTPVTKHLENPRYRQNNIKQNGIEIQTVSQSVLITD
ncbi:uncharacterized protein LOC128960372 [Oppia nitens]|uniref:uncharacterized protein LOC128960372 n=1 Tax=Oppia nitens TaxID=1686743 RepID=UPI0023DAAAD1|nr:uncharacterized protein LOC128960372 [Oppia nitens]